MKVRYTFPKIYIYFKNQRVRDFEIIVEMVEFKLYSEFGMTQNTELEPKHRHIILILILVDRGCIRFMFYILTGDFLSLKDSPWRNCVFYTNTLTLILQTYSRIS